MSMGRATENEARERQTHARWQIEASGAARPRRRARRMMHTIVAIVGLTLAAPLAAAADQLYSNGPLITHPNGGAGNQHASRVQTSLGLDTYGLRTSLANGQAVADDFTVPAPGWTITNITVFAYQQDSGFTSTLTDLRMVIMRGRPDAPGSSVVWGTPVNNVLANTYFTNIFRDAEDAVGSSRRPIMAAVAHANVTLPPGTYWLVWSFGGLGEGPSTPFVTIPGAVSTGNGLFHVGGVWMPAADGDLGTPQALPFVLEGLGAAAPQLALSLNASTFRAGDRFTLSASLTGSAPGIVDAYVLIDMPTGQVMSLTSGGLLPGVIPFARGVQPFSGVLLDTALPVVPVGPYSIRGILASGGTPVGPISQITFTIEP